MLNKALLLCACGEPPPEPGYVKATLTIGSRSSGKTKEYGFSSGPFGVFGSLVPSQGYVRIIFDSAGWYVYATRPFYYEGVKFDTAGTANLSISAWEYMVGQTVEVWLAPE